MTESGRFKSAFLRGAKGQRHDPPQEGLEVSGGPGVACERVPELERELDSSVLG